jgi:hypothetical protein
MLHGSGLWFSRRLSLRLRPRCESQPALSSFAFEWCDGQLL